MTAELDALLGDDDGAREQALGLLRAAPEHVRTAVAGRLAKILRYEANFIAIAEDHGETSALRRRDLERLLRALAIVDVAAARVPLVRLADEGTPSLKSTLARALRGVDSAEAHAVLAYLLSDEDARADALAAITEAPWPEVLPDLIEIAEVDDASLCLAIEAIARCGATSGPRERNAAADFLVEQLDDEELLATVVPALLRHGPDFPGVAARAERLVGDVGRRKVAGLVLLAGAGRTEDHLRELATRKGPVELEASQLFLTPLLHDPSPSVREAAHRAALVTGLRESGVL
jgi:hypothetical protein